MANDPLSLPSAPAALPARLRPFVDWATAGGDPGIAFAEASVTVTEFPAAVRRLLRAVLLEAVRQGRVDFAATVHPLSVQPIAGKLFAAYQVDGGHMQLAGCQLDDHLVCRAAWSDGAVTHHTGAGDEVPDALLAVLGLDALTPQVGVGDASPEQAALAIAYLCDRAQSTATALQHATLVSCRHATGKVRFTIGHVTWDLAFTGWTGDFSPPPFVCPHTGIATYHLAATDDGRIAAAEEIATCHRTGRRLLRKELARCAVSGVYVLPQYAVTCPVTGETVEQTVLVECATCRQLVSPHALQEQQCAACRTLSSIESNDPRLVRVLSEYPALAAWRQWKLSETADVLILEGHGILQRLLVVLDRQSLHCRHLATRLRLSTHWKPVEQAAFRETLG